MWRGVATLHRVDSGDGLEGVSERVEVGAVAGGDPGRGRQVGGSHASAEAGLVLEDAAKDLERGAFGDELHARDRRVAFQCFANRALIRPSAVNGQEDLEVK